MIAKRAQRYEAAGRAELRRDGASNTKLGNDYNCHKNTIINLAKLFRANDDDFRRLAINEAEQYYKSRGIHVSAYSVRAYLLNRLQRYCQKGDFDYQSAEQFLKAHEEKFEVAFRQFQGAPLELERLQNIISGGIGWIAVQDFEPTAEASNVATALQGMNDELDQLDPRPVDPIGTAPPDIHEIVSPVFKHRELWIPDSIWCNLNNGRQPR
jgi:hypothetical protein